MALSYRRCAVVYDVGTDNRVYRSEKTQKKNVTKLVTFFCGFEVGLEVFPELGGCAAFGFAEETVEMAECIEAAGIADLCHGELCGE